MREYEITPQMMISRFYQYLRFVHEDYLHAGTSGLLPSTYSVDEYGYIHVRPNIPGMQLVVPLSSGRGLSGFNFEIVNRGKSVALNASAIEHLGEFSMPVDLSLEFMDRFCIGSGSMIGTLTGFARDDSLTSDVDGDVLLQVLPVVAGLIGTYTEGMESWTLSNVFNNEVAVAA